MNVADEIKLIKQQLADIGRRLASIRSSGEVATHHTTHEQGGSDSIKLDDLATPTTIQTLTPPSQNMDF